MRNKSLFLRSNVYISLCFVILLHIGVVSAQNTSPLCFTARNGSVTVRFDIKNVTHTIQYSTDSLNWNTYTSNSDIPLNANQSVCFRAASNQTVATAFGNTDASTSSRFYFLSTDSGKVEGSGNIMSLYGPDCPCISLIDYCFAYLFTGCVSLTSAPKLTATNLAPYCYSHMFGGCSSLLATPVLSATNLADYCYSGMFGFCSSLNNLPGLPALTLATRCYQGMFSGCTSLTSAPALPATTLADGCYCDMFDGCTSLTAIPDLPATVLPNSCYTNMFKNCSSLAVMGYGPGKKWQIKATAIGSYALGDMFLGTMGSFNPSPNTIYYVQSDTSVYGNLFCLTAKNGGVGVVFSIRNITASTIKYSFDKMLWYSCSETTNINLHENEKVYFCADSNRTTAMPFGQSLHYNSSKFIFTSSVGGTIEASGNIMSLYGQDCPNLPLQSYAFSCMFYGCNLLTSAPVLPDTTLATYCYSSMFNGCTSLTAAPDLPATTLASHCYECMFSGCTSLSTAPTLPATNLANHCYDGMFWRCSSLTNSPSLPATNLATGCYERMFYYCTSLDTAPALPATTLSDSCYSGMFEGCSSLTSPPTLPAAIMTPFCYAGMFNGCTSLSVAPALSSTTLANSCYSGMFYGCRSLVTPPELPATNLAPSCYSGMFEQCSSLTSAPSLQATTMREFCYCRMFEGCTLLANAPDLPATTLDENCYFGMFNGCTSIKKLPTLPATTLAHYCYFQMFKNCTSLIVNIQNPGKQWTITAPRTETWALDDMFTGTSGTMNGTPSVNTTYYVRSGHHNIIATSNNSTMGLASGTGLYEDETVATLVATSNPHYHFVGWSNGSIEQTITLIVSRDTTLTAYFAIDKHNVTTSGINCQVTGDGLYDYGSNATLTAEGNPHYHFVQWSDGDTTNPRTVNIIGDTAYTAIFEIDKHTIAASGTNGEVAGGGTFDYDSTIYLTAIPDNHYYFARWSDGDTANPRMVAVSQDSSFTAIFEGNIHTISGIGENGTVSGGGSYHYGSTTNLTATANDHYHFVGWADSIVSNPRTDTVRGDTTYTAIFETDKHSVNASGENGSITGTGIFDYGSTDTLIADGNDHYHFVRWSDGDTSNPKIITVTNDISLTATFEIDKHIITVDGANGTVTGGGTYDYGTSVILTAVADEHYHFVGWSDGVTTAQRTVVVIGDTTYTAIFEIDKHIVSDSSVNGSVVGIGEYDYGSTVTVSASPDEHYSFVSWLDGDTSETRTFVLTGDTVVSALFDLTEYHINATCEHGVVTGYGVYRYPDVVTLTVEPDEGYRFVEWSDGNEYNPRIFVAEEDLTLEAICEEIPGVGVDEVKDDTPQFYIVGNMIYNPTNELLRVFSVSGKLLLESDGNIELMGYPVEVYVVVDEKGHSLKVVVR